MSKEKITVEVVENRDKKINLANLAYVLIGKLIIPSYQRPHAWTEENMEDLFKTISASQNNKDICFFGSIILLSKGYGKGLDRDECYIIDGQQRITSFLLILKVILVNLTIVKDKLLSEETKLVSEERLKSKLDNGINELETIIEKVALEREDGNDKNEKSVLSYINSKNSEIPKEIKKHIKEIFKYAGIKDEEEIDEAGVKDEEEIDEAILKKKKDIDAMEGIKDLEVYAENLLEFLNFILEKIKFCIIHISGEDSENFAINLFNTLNTTGEPLTAFEVLKSTLSSEKYKENSSLSKDLENIQEEDSSLSKDLENIQEEIREKYKKNRSETIKHTGKLLLFLPLYRGDFNKERVSDKHFKIQMAYIGKILNLKKNKSSNKQNIEDAKNIVRDLEIIKNFYIKDWSSTEGDALKCLEKTDEKACFKFLVDLKHERVLPLFVRFFNDDKENFKTCVKMCAAFSSLWRAYHRGGTGRIDTAYKEISLELKGRADIDKLSEEMKRLFIKKIKSKEEKKLKEKWMQAIWMQAIKNNPIYSKDGGKKLSRFLLFAGTNKTYYDDDEREVVRNGKLDIFRSWDGDDYYETIEHIIPQSEPKDAEGLIHGIGNLTLLPGKLNSSLGRKPFEEKREEFKKYCHKKGNADDPYLPILKDIVKYTEFKKTQIEERSEMLSGHIWKTLAEEWLGWKE